MVKYAGRGLVIKRPGVLSKVQMLNTPSTAGNSMTGSERPSPEPLLKKEASPAALGGREFWNALEPSNPLNYRVWGIPAVLGNSRLSGISPEFPPESPSRTGCGLNSRFESLFGYFVFFWVFGPSDRHGT